MAIVRGSTRLLLNEARQRPFSGRLMQLGRQSIYLNAGQLRRWADQHGVPLTPGPFAPSNIGFLAETGCIDDKSFFRALGFSTVESIDFSDYEGASHVHDLNRPVPTEWHQQYDVVAEFGTIEHLFHLPQALANIGAMLKTGGRVIHLSPACNYLDHGFFMFSPTFFHDYYRANGWRIEEIRLVVGTWRSDLDPWHVYRYRPQELQAPGAGGFDRSKRVSVYVVATKSPQARDGRIPQQSDCRTRWNDGGPSPGGTRPGQAWMRWLRGHRRLYYLAARLYGLARNRRQRPLARY